MLVRRQFATTLRVKGEKRQFIFEHEDFAVFSPHLYKTKKTHAVYASVMDTYVTLLTEDFDGETGQVKKISTGVSTQPTDVSWEELSEREDLGVLGTLDDHPFGDVIA